ncbi:hypothetical protein H0H92_009151 [Tricholoma furcatifolium]|nr:hypothetical protein H0H92_009151 [Tricholoma furcatifolium]
MSEFPWDRLKAETLRSICADLGLARFVSKDIAMEVLKKVETDGLDDTIEQVDEIIETKKQEKASTAPPTSRRPRNVEVSPATRPKRKRDPSELGPRNRRKSERALAAASMDEPQPKRRRGRPSTARASAPTDGAPNPKRPRGRPTKAKLTDAEPKPKRPRGRPPKVKDSGPQSARRQIFDGVEVEAPRSGRSIYKGKGKAHDHGQDEDGGEEDAEGEIDMEEHVAHVSSVIDTRPESSLASSNKENESIHGDDTSELQVSVEENHNGIYVPVALRNRLLMSFSSRKLATLPDSTSSGGARGP